MTGDKRFDKLLVLDLDETLVHATEQPLSRPADFRIDEIHVYVRPGLASFLDDCLSWFTVGVWTSSSEDYARAIVSRVFPPAAPIAFVWSRNRCTCAFDPERRKPVWIKDLKKLRKRWPLERVLVVDDTPAKLVRSFGNLVQVQEWNGDPTDRELAALTAYLEELGPIANVRTVEKRGWRSRSA